MSHPYDLLTPERMLDAVESVGLYPDGRSLALNSYENRVYQIGIEDHPGVVAKFYRPHRWSNAAILEEHQFTQELADQEIPVVAPLPFNDQTLLDDGEFRFALFPRRGGRTPDLDNLDHLEWIGRFIGRIHLVGRHKPFQHRTTLSSERLGTQAREKVLQSTLLPYEQQKAYGELSAQLIDICEQRFTEIAPNTQRLHGDCHHGNILWTDAGPHFVDMDDSCNGPAIQDLWMLLSGDRREMRLQLDALLEGYQSFCTFEPSELGLIEPLRTLRLLHYTAWLVERWDDPAFPLAFPWLEESSYWAGYIADLQQQLLRMQEPPLQLFGN